MSLESNKTLGGVGAILLAIPIANLVGIILVLIAMKGMADHYQDDDIFKNALYGFIFGIIGVVALIAVGVMFFVTFSATIPSTTYPLAGLTIFILAFVTMYIFSLIGAIFYRKAFNTLSEKSNEKMFESAGLLLLIGAIIPVIGEILRFIAWILAAVGFFSIRVPVQATMGQPVTQVSGENKFCQNCGAKNKSEASFCERCGQKFN